MMMVGVLRASAALVLVVVAIRPPLGVRAAVSSPAFAGVDPTMGVAAEAAAEACLVRETQTALPADGVDKTKNRPPHRPLLTYREMWDMYGCDHDETYYQLEAHTQRPTDGRNASQPAPRGSIVRPVPDAKTWQYLRAAYNRVVRPNLCPRRSSVDGPGNHNGSSGSAPHPQPPCLVEGVDANLVDEDGFESRPSTSTSTSITAVPDADYTNHHHEWHPTGFRVPVAVRPSPGRGRGVFAASDIAKGALVWVSQYEGYMSSGFVYRQLLASLPTNALRCDVMTFSYFTVTDDNDDKDDDDDNDDEEEDTDELECELKVDATNDVVHVRVDDDTGDEDFPPWKGEEASPSNAEIADPRCEATVVDIVNDEPSAEEGWDDEDEEEWEDGDDEEWEDGDEEASWDGDDDEDDEVHPTELPRNFILVNLDEAALMNADWESPDGRTNINVGTHADVVDDGSNEHVTFDSDKDEGPDGVKDPQADRWARYVALRDIRAGEEILCAYHDFARDEAGWAHFGL